MCDKTSESSLENSLQFFLFSSYQQCCIHIQTSSIDFCCKSIDWFQYESNIGLIWVKVLVLKLQRMCFGISQRNYAMTLELTAQKMKFSIKDFFIFCAVTQNICYNYVTHEFHSKSTLCSCLNVKKLLARNRHHIRTHNRLFRERTLNHLAKLAKWLTVGLRIKWLLVRIPLLSLETQV